MYQRNISESLTVDDGWRGARPDRAITHYRYAELLHEKGDPEQAREQFAKATALFRDMEMTWWLEQVEELGKRLGAN